MTDKINIARREVSGNLKDLKQIYEINYLEKTNNLTDKVEIAILLERKNGDRYAYRSLRFNSLEELKQFIIDTIKAYSLITKKRLNDELSSNLKLTSDGNEFKNATKSGVN